MPPSASGTLATTPLAHALVYARNRRLTGLLELVTPEGARALVTIWRGLLERVDTTPVGLCPSAYFGAIAYELGFIDTATLDETLLLIAETKRLHGHVLVERGALTAAQRDEVLVEQIHRKVHHLFSFPGATTYAFYDAPPSLTAPPVLVDCVGPAWRGLRDHPPTAFVEETKRRVADHALRVVDDGRLRLPSAETKLFAALMIRPMTLAELIAETDLPPARVELLVYLLIIAKRIESVSGARTHPSTGALPVSAPSGPIAVPSGYVRASSSARMPAALPPSSSRRMAAATPAPQTPAQIGAEAIVRRAARVDAETYFETLGVDESASAEAARAAFIRLAKSWHPDRLPPALASVRDEVEKIYCAMTRAQQTLCDPDARRAYLAPKEPSDDRKREEIAREIGTALERREFAKVVTLCQVLLARNAEDAEALATLAWAKARGGEASEDELRDALAKIDRAVNVDRTSEQAVYFRGLVHKRLGNVAAACRDFARAFQLDPGHVPAERELRVLAMRVKNGSGEHRLIAPILERMSQRKR